MERRPSRRSSKRRRPSKKVESVNNVMTDNGMSITVTVLGLVLIILVVYLFFEHRNTVIIKSKEGFACGGEHDRRREGFSNCHNRREGFSNHDDKRLVCVLASWCGHCKTFKKDVLKKFKKENPDIKVKVHEDDETANKKYGVSGFPSIFLEKNGSKPIQYKGKRTVVDLFNFFMNT